MKSMEAPKGSDPSKDREAVIHLLARILAKSWLRKKAEERALTDPDANTAAASTARLQGIEQFRRPLDELQLPAG